MTTSNLQTIDCQVHCYERNRPERPWVGFLQGPDEVTGDDMVAAMDAVGVDGAILISPFSMYRYDASYALEVYAKHPTRFGLVRPFDPHSDSIAEEMAEWTGNAGVVGARIMLTAEPFEADHQGLNQILDAGAAAGVPVNVMCSTRLSLFGELARRHPNTQMVIDTLGITPSRRTAAPGGPGPPCPGGCVTGALDNVGNKISRAAGTLAQEHSLLFRYSWSLAEFFDAYGAGRVPLGWTGSRATKLLNYEQGVEAFRVTDQLSDAEREVLMGGTLKRVYKWSPGQG